MHNLNIVITGASGYIGSVLSKLCFLKHNRVLGIDLKRPKHKYYNKFVTCNFREDDVARMIDDWDADVVFHLAASADVTDSTIYPLKYYDNNTGATSEFLNNLIRYDVRVPIIFSSTAAVYGEGNNRLTEDSLTNPINSYGISKLMCEQILKDAYICNGMNSVSFRYFNVAGAYGDVGDHLDSGHVIQRLCDAQLSKKDFIIYGSDYNTFDGTCVRDFLHVLDVCRAHFYALNYLKNSPGSHVFNLGTGFEHSVKNLSEKFDVNVVEGSRRNGDPAYLIADGNKFVEKAGFRYLYSNIDNIIASAIEWYFFNKDNHAD